MYDSMEAEFEVQRTIKRAELTAFLWFLKKVIGPIKVHVDSKGIIVGLWRGERTCMNPKACDAGLWINSWEELHRLAARDIAVEVEHVKAHRTRKDKKEMPHFEKFVSERNEKADELAEAGAMLEKRGQRQSSRSEKRCMQPCSLQPAFTVWWKSVRIVKSSSRSQKKSGFSWIRKERRRSIDKWYADATKYRCMMCGRGSKCMKMPGTCTEPKYLSENVGKMRKAASQRSPFGKKNR